MQSNRFLLWLLAVMCLLAACGKEIKHEVGIINMTDPVHYNSLKLNRNGGFVYYRDLLFSGTAYKTYPDGSYTRVNFENGRKEGRESHYFPDGRLSYECFFINGKKHGKARSWWNNGNLRAESQFKNGVAHGTQYQWYKSGARFKELNMVEGMEEGLQKAWRENGKIYNNYEAKNGRIFGLKRANLCYELIAEKIENN